MPAHAGGVSLERIREGGSLRVLNEPLVIMQSSMPCDLQELQLSCCLFGLFSHKLVKHLSSNPGSKAK